MTEPTANEPSASTPSSAQAPASNATGVSAPAEPERRRRSGVPVWMLLVVIVAAAGLVVWQWYDTRHQVARLEEELARRLTESDSRMRQALETVQEMRTRVSELQKQVATLEAGLAESQNQQIALEALYQQLARSSDEWALAEIEQTLTIAAQQLQLAGNVKAALLALETADGRLQRLDRPQLAQLRKVIERDIDRLQRSPFVDVVGITIKLDHLMEQVDTLPLAMQQRPPPQPAPAAVDEANPFVRLAREMWQDLKHLVRIQSVDRREVPLLDPEQSFFLRENLKLRLLSARIALLQRDGKSYRNDLLQALEWVERFYDTADPQLAGVLTTLRQLAEVDIGIEVPDINASLAAVRDFKLTRERGAR